MFCCTLSSSNTAIFCGTDADAPFQVVARLRHRLAEQADLATIVGEQLQDAIDGGRLSTAVRSEQAEDLARCDLEREVIERHRASVTFDKVLDGYDRFHGFLFLPTKTIAPSSRE